jgi:hypothetical protein
MPEIARFHVVHCVLCDDVRIEVGGKEILIGVYPVGIQTPFMPWFMVVSTWLRVIWSGDGEAQVEIRINNPKGIESGIVKGSARSIWRGFVSSLTFSGLAFQVEMEGIYAVEIKLNGGAWEHIYQFPVYYVSPAPATSA